MLQCVAACYSVLLCVAVLVAAPLHVWARHKKYVLQCVAVCCGELQCSDTLPRVRTPKVVQVSCDSFLCVTLAVCCSVCSVLQCVAVCCCATSEGIVRVSHDSFICVT